MNFLQNAIKSINFYKNSHKLHSLDKYAKKCVLYEYLNTFMCTLILLCDKELIMFNNNTSETLNETIFDNFLMNQWMNYEVKSSNLDGWYLNIFVNNFNWQRNWIFIVLLRCKFVMYFFIAEIYWILFAT